MQYEQETLRKLQLSELEILTVFDSFCATHSLNYFLDSGTALGAKRHKGFIPWDDDIDVGMLRKDYNRFITLAEKGLPDGYSLHHFNNTPGYAGMFAKIYKDGTVFETEETIDARCPQGIFIDIFPYDYVSSNKQERDRQIAQATHWQHISYLYHSGHIIVPFKGLKADIVKIACKVAHVFIRACFKRSEIEKKFNTATLCKEAPSDCLQVFAYPLKQDIKESVLIPSSRIEFEGRLFSCPARMEQYLVSMYGTTWNELPPVEERKNHAPIKLCFSNENQVSNQL